MSRRDIPIAMAKKLNGATTVAATMILASLAGIKIFATGGIGGVHRGLRKPWMSLLISWNLPKLMWW